MASFVAKPNQLALMANAFSGMAKGANDFANLKQRRDQLEEQKRQHDENIKLGFDRLDEQIRQFDISTEQKAALQKQAEEARFKFQDKELTYRTEADDKRIAADLKRAGMQAYQQRQDRELRRKIQQQNIGLGQTVNTMQTLGAAQLHKERKEHEDKVATWTPNPDGTFNTPDGKTVPSSSAIFPYESRRNAMAQNLASRLNFTDNPTQSQIALAQQQIDNHDSMAERHAQNRIEAEQSKYLGKAAAAGAFGATYTDTGQPMSAAYKGIYYATDPKTGQEQVVQRPGPNAFAELRGQIAARGAEDNPLIKMQLNNFDRLQGLMSQHATAAEDGLMTASTLKDRIDNHMRPDSFPGMNPSDFSVLQEFVNNQIQSGAIEREMRSGRSLWRGAEMTPGERSAMRRQQQQQSQMTDEQLQQQGLERAESARQSESNVQAARESVATRLQEKLAAGEVDDSEAIRNAIDVGLGARAGESEIEYRDRVLSGVNP